MLTRLHSIPRFGLPYTAGDFGSALMALFQGVKPPDAFQLLGDSPKLWTRSGRQALYLLVKGLDLEEGAGVALPLFTDPSLVSAIAAAGRRPVFIDVDPQTLTMSPESLAAARGKFSAVLIVHLFGHVADIPALLSVAGNVPVIEDTAHAPLSFLHGRMAGEFGVASFYSFASTKYWPAGGGGLAVVHYPRLARRMTELAAELPSPPRLYEIRMLMMQAAKAIVFTPRLYGVLGKPLRQWVEQWALLEPQLDEMSIPRSQASAARRQARRFGLRVERQRANSLRLLGNLAGAEDVVLPRERSGARYNYHLFPVLLRDAVERRAVIAGMWSKFVDTSTIYSGVVDECRKYGYEGGCPVAESVASRLITLPNYAALNNREIDAVAEAFLGSLRACRASGPRYPIAALGFRPSSRRREPETVNSQKIA
jgi:dTDP-4-amino-4,6-dideoxygalactose transaminase